MAIFRLRDEALEKVNTTTFAAESIRERQDLQRILRSQIDVISPGTLVIAEEFGEFEERRRRIDLLGIDKDANLVVIELKRTEDGGHMELQAIRYAAMVSGMTFDRAVSVFRENLDSLDTEGEAEELLLEHLDWEEPDEESFARDVRIVLASAEFSREITSAVIWLNDHGLDIRCIRLRPYKLDNELILDVQQLIPLPEAEDYQIQLRDKQQRERQSRRASMDYTKHDLVVFSKSYPALAKRWMIFYCVKNLLENGISPGAILSALTHRKNRFFEIFPGELSADQVIEEIAKKWPNSKRPMFKRFFWKDEELFHVNGKTYILSNQWGSRTLEIIDAFATAFPEAKISYKESL